MHYPDFKAAPRFFNLYFPGGGSWQRALSAFDQNPAPLCFQKCRDILHSFMLCLFSRAPGTFWEGEAPSQELFFFWLCFFAPRPDKCLLKKQTLIQNVTTSYETWLLPWCGLSSQHCLRKSSLLSTEKHRIPQEVQSYSNLVWEKHLEFEDQ